MPPRMPLAASSRVWKCPSCRARTFTSSRVSQKVGPEHPRYIEVQEPPQNSFPPRKWVKGVLPVPRDIFATGKHDVSSEEAVAKTTQEPQRRRKAEAGSREEWKIKLSETRRQNLREGVRELKSRQERSLRVRSESSRRHQAEREAALHRPEREDERLTAPSHSLDLDSLLHGAPQDPSRDQRIAESAEKTAAYHAEKQAERLDSLHTLYTHARSFIVNTEQLDEAIDKTFGTNENPVMFGNYWDRDNAHSVWALGRPDRVHDMLNRANNQQGRFAVDVSKDLSVNEQRMRKIAELLTGGTMDDGSEKIDETKERRL